MNNREQIREKLEKEYPIADEVSFNDFNIEQKLQNQLQLELKYYDLLQNAKYVYNKIDNILIDKQCELYDTFRFEHERNLSKPEIELYYMPKHPDIKLIKERMALQEVKVHFFEICYRSAKQLQWNIQTFLKNRE
jgi:hypothetical protein